MDLEFIIHLIIIICGITFMIFIGMFLVSSFNVEVIEEYPIECHNLSDYYNISAFGLKEDIEGIWGMYRDYRQQYFVYDTSGNMQMVQEYTNHAKTHVEYTDEKTPSVKHTIRHFIIGDVERYTIIIPKNGVILGTTMSW